ncbi:patatin-like phospholipase family protein [Pusillimonas noertemannii]|uniref:NTE family protein n=1 Tax=Pusillimonas noertemannii TaxID=305977 RepID=A0A2U1CRA8_9BURK|nr:patatin-like phospholipase family protein [Pusillimonas noertemannii]NYT67742.1 patatin-like phospholipase family protein [Pusillimonas noertemannii]PVY68413.1 NTE family protein [Pusillimonas noertemannii]TFL12105.1 patatin-like phospholipase family protein [Pusillimonas noertemannii]
MRKGFGSSPVGLVLMGGGARAAYQVGVLSGILQILDPDRSPQFCNPFPILCGTSAGAINAAALACRANDIHLAVDRLVTLWDELHTEHIYRSDALSLLGTGWRWLSMLALGWLWPGLRGRRPSSLLDNSPLADLLAATLDFDRLNDNLDQGELQALAITATAFVTGEHLTFYNARHLIDPWTRSLRRAVPGRVGVEHLMASSAIPFIFPAQAILVNGKTEWCGDGSMRQLAPLSPAIHLGAERVLVVGTGHRDDTHAEERQVDSHYPPLAQVGGHVLSSIFMDGLSMDVERLERINDLLALAPAEKVETQSLRTVSALTITPSKPLDNIAMEFLHQMPPSVRTLFRVLGVSSGSGATTGGALVSYLLFEAGYTRELIRLGRADSMERIEEVKAFFKETPQ